jgi:hypothetical protein
MHDQVISALHQKLGELERRGAKLRLGVVSDMTPLSVLLGGADSAFTDVRAVDGAAPLNVGDTIAALVAGNTLIVLGAVGGRRTISGSISSAGAIVAGTGFTVAKPGTGLYTVTFDVAMPTRPAVTLTPLDTAISAASHASLANGAPPTTAGFHVVTANAGATTTINVGFDFIAMAT